jgi:dTDP-4-dehydrorhamnose reductase
VKKQVKQLVSSFEPEVIINCAAMTNVDACEKERELAWKVNVGSVENLIEAARRADTRIVHVSSDYVFDGKNGPYDELARPNPISYYGRTKLAGENILTTSGVPHAIVRTMVLYGAGYHVKQNFALWLIKSLTEGKPVRVVDDQIGNPTLADDLAYAVMKIIELDRSGLFHIAGPDLMSRYDFATALAKAFAFNRKLITPVKTSAFKQPAPRPLRSGFITLKAQTDLGLRMSDVGQGLTALKNQIQYYQQQAKN